MILRKITALLLISCMLFTLVACGSQVKPSKAPTSNGDIVDITITESPEDTPFPTPLVTDNLTPVQSVSPNPIQTTNPTQLPDHTEPPAETDMVDLDAFFIRMDSSYSLNNMRNLDTELIDAYYSGLSSIFTKQFVGKISMITAAAHELIIIECENSDDVATVRTIFEARKQMQVDGGAWYPASIQMWVNAQICESGNYIMLISHTNSSEISACFYALFD